MTLRLGVVADDYTGASDLANTLARNGLRTVQTVGVPDAGLALPEVDAVVVALKTRSVGPGVAVARSRAASAWLRARGAGHVMFKVCSTFDSTDAGNIGPVTDALRVDAGAAVVAVCPAFPETGRTVFQGHLFVGRQPLHESSLKDHPLNPMRDSDLVRVLGRQSGAPVGLVALDVVERGAEAVAEELGTLAAQGVGSAIVDAVAERHLVVLGEAALRFPVSTGASGLGLGLARALSGGASVAGDAGAPVGGFAAVVAGSCSRATLAQVAAAEAAGLAVLRIDAARVLAGGVVAEALAWAQGRLAAGPVVVASSAAPDAVARAQGMAADVGHAVEQALAEVVAGLVAMGVRRLVVAGGETSGAAVDRLGIPAFLVGPEIAPGVPVLRTLGGGEAMMLALKSGNFGGEDFFARALGMMK
ncbi:MAG: 3-oxo-tetronate kinase [Janthinobacterium lividum]